MAWNNRRKLQQIPSYTGSTSTLFPDHSSWDPEDHDEQQITVNLILNTDDLAQRLIIPITHAEFVIGRDRACHLRPTSRYVSRQHCIIVISNIFVHVRDLGSRNGTLVNGIRVDGRQELQHGDILQIDSICYYVSIERR
jgi:hypothetical protein